jgi:hypothetical protein
MGSLRSALFAAVCGTAFAVLVVVGGAYVWSTKKLDESYPCIDGIRTAVRTRTFAIGQFSATTKSTRSEGEQCQPER